MTYEKVYEGVKKALSKSDASKIDRDFAVQCNIRGEGEGSFYIAYKEGVLSVEPYDYKDNDAQLYADGDTFLKMFTKRISGREAFEKGQLGFDGSVEVVMMLEKLEAKKVEKKAPASKKAPAEKKVAAEKKAPVEKKVEPAVPAAPVAPAAKEPEKPEKPKS
ncbi:MAG: SCP2 sterol-binding domain-containing protein [Oscillospiraceae bacterium]|jgi:putative sterol carrier protein|nr:SCP2 sterol-binding domain-containing protein [Oscillospiraceae bacterium]